MKIKFQISNPKFLIIIASFALLGSALFSSCGKTSSSSSTSFIGTYTANSGSGCSNAITINAGNSSSNVVIPSTFGSGSCTKNINIICVISGNNLTIASQAFTDNCSNTGTITGNGTLNGNTLTLNLVAVDPTGSYPCTFTGHK